MGKKSFLFDLEWAEVLKDYRPEVRHEVYDAIIEYAASGTLSGELKPLAAMAFSFIKRQMDYNRERYETETEKRREAGRKGGLARQRAQAEEVQPSDSHEAVEQIQAEPSNAKECLANQAEPSNAKECLANQADIVYDNDNVYDYDKLFTLPLGVGGEQEILVRKAYTDLFFASPKLNDFIKRWKTTLEELRETCETVLDEWTIKDERHISAPDARAHFVDTIKCRYQDKIEKQKDPPAKRRRPSGKTHTGTADKTPPPQAESDIERLDRQQKERAEAFAEMEKNAVKPAEYIRSLGYDPEKVTMLQVMDADWRAQNPPTLEPTIRKETNRQTKKK